MKLRKKSKRTVAWLLAAVLCLSPVFSSGDVDTAQAATAAQAGVREGSHVLQNPVINAEDGGVIWDCVYFGNYWQGEYTAQSPAEGEDDVVHTDTDGTKYIVRADAKCYKYEPIKWRVLSVSEDGTEAFLMADKCLDARPYHTEEIEKETLKWEDCTLRKWLNETFMETAFETDEVKNAIIQTGIRTPFYSEDAEVAEDDDEYYTLDDIYLLSLEDALKREYGFVSDYISSEGKFSQTETRAADSTDFAKSCEDGVLSEGYLLRTPGATRGYVLSTDSIADGAIPVTELFGTQVTDKGHGIRPVLYLDLTKTDTWTYAGQVKQDKTEIAPDVTPAVPTEAPTAQPGVTMAPGQKYPKNPVVNKNDLKKNTWDCIYFGKYFKTKITPTVLAQAGEHNMMKADENGEYLVRHEQGYFQYEPLKWRVLSINEDGTDAFLIADEVVDVAPYYNETDEEITWENSDIREWLNQVFQETAFTGEEQAKILESKVKTADNPWSGESGGNDTADKLYLLSVEEAMELSYGFGSNAEEGDTRKIVVTDYASAEEKLDDIYSDAGTYWLRSAGPKKGYPAAVGYWGEGAIQTEASVMSNDSTRKLGVRPVMHVDLSDTAMWSYAGQVTPEGVVIPTTENITPEPTQKPKKPAKPTIKNLKNKAGKKVTITLSKKISGAAGYQVAYAAKASMKGEKKKSFKGVSVTIKGLKKKKTYYFRVRAYAKADGKTVYGSWSSKKSIKVKK